MADRSECPFCFVGFDWKGTLEVKHGTKWARFNLALDATIDVIESYSQDDISRELTEFREMFVDLMKGDTDSSSDSNKRVCTVSELLLESLSCSGIDFPAQNEDNNNQLTPSICEDVFLSTYNTPIGDDSKHLYHGARDVILMLRDAGIPFGLLRNSRMPRSQFQQTLDECGVGDLFRVESNVLLSGEIGLEKPNPQVFWALASKCLNPSVVSSTHPARYVFVGNETDFDVVGARSAGWQAILLTSTEPHSKGLANYDCPHYGALAHVLFPNSTTIPLSLSFLDAHLDSQTLEQLREKYHSKYHGKFQKKLQKKYVKHFVDNPLSSTHTQEEHDLRFSAMKDKYREKYEQKFEKKFKKKCKKALKKQGPLPETSEPAAVHPFFLPLASQQASASNSS